MSPNRLRTPSIEWGMGRPFYLELKKVVFLLQRDLSCTFLRLVSRLCPIFRLFRQIFRRRTQVPQQQQKQRIQWQPFCILTVFAFKGGRAVVSLAREGRGIGELLWPWGVCCCCCCLMRWSRGEKEKVGSPRNNAHTTGPVRNQAEGYRLLQCDRLSNAV